MLPAERHEQILEIIDKDGSVEVGNLSSTFGVTPMTIRRDLDLLAQEGLVLRKHGGAIKVTRVSKKIADDPPYEKKRLELREEKEAIGVKAAQLVSDSETLIIDSGSTTYWLAKNLATKKSLRIVTNDLHIGLELASNPDSQVNLVGGVIRQGIFSTWGPNAEAYLKEISVAKSFIAADAVDLKGVLNATPYEANIKKLMVAAAEKVILLVDSSKFSRLALVRICGWDKIAQIITDQNLPSDIARHLEETGVEVTIV